MRRSPLLTALPAVLLCSCAGIAEPVVGGSYRVVLDSPYGGEGGALLELVGPGIIGVSAPGAVLATHLAGDTLRILYFNDPAYVATPPPVAFQLEMQAGASAPQGRVLQVTDAAGRLRDFVGSYDIRFTR
jgi:uncharacterized protein (AIM24 family)